MAYARFSSYRDTIAARLSSSYRAVRRGLACELHAAQESPLVWGGVPILLAHGLAAAGGAKELSDVVEGIVTLHPAADAAGIVLGFSLFCDTMGMRQEDDRHQSYLSTPHTS